MDARQRNWYLGVLGVVRYLPRDAGPEASESPAPETAGAAVCPQDIELQTARLLHPVASPAPSKMPVVGKPEVERPGRVDQQPVRQSDEELLQFRLGFWQPSADLVVLSAMPPGARPSQIQQQMLANLLKAIGQLPAPLASVELIDWPLSRGFATTAVGLQGARELLDAFFDVKSKLQPFTTSLLMGELTPRLFTEQQLQVGDKITLRCLATGVVTHSLADMENNPALKRETWEAIRFLAGQ